MIEEELYCEDCERSSEGETFLEASFIITIGQHVSCALWLQLGGAHPRLRYARTQLRLKQPLFTSTK